MSEAQPVLIAGQWRPSDAVGTFQPDNPSTKEPTGETYPVSSAAEVDEAIAAAACAAEAIAALEPGTPARFLERFAERIEARAEEFVAMAHAESGLPAPTRLAAIERCRRRHGSAPLAALAGSGVLLPDDPATIITPESVALAFGISALVGIFGTGLHVAHADAQVEELKTAVLEAARGTAAEAAIEEALRQADEPAAAPAKQPIAR